MDMNTFAAQVVDEHELFLMALNGRYLQLLQPGQKPTPRDVVEFAAWARKTRDALRERLSDKIDALVKTAGVEVDEVTSAAMHALATDFYTSFALITSANVSTVMAALRAGRDDLGKMFTRALGGAMGELMTKKMQKLDFKAEDSAGRKWEASRLLSFYAREFVYRMKLLKQLADIGDGLAEVFNPDHEEDGMVFSPKGIDPTRPSFKDLEKTVFHPNSKAEVRPYAAP